MVPSNSVYPWRNLSLLLITSNSATGTPPKGSYTVTLNSLGLVEGNTYIGLLVEESITLLDWGNMVER
ncbi:hypothetical protein [Saccharolobus islandicus]|uniref:hypothetical protein n=1 Tax=Saccharolobus islandicus TaxID=43080 RepID=UPI000A710D0D|nr:hypothetical protein [Sulfolobus islandicus]